MKQIIYAVLMVVSCYHIILSKSYDDNFHSNGLVLDQRNKSDFCYFNDFNSMTIAYHKIEKTRIDNFTGAAFYKSVEFGIPFVISGVTDGWKANTKWDNLYFKKVFQNFELFSSTFATNASPVFDSVPNDDRIYYGIFINDRGLADMLAEDYDYPPFIPHELKIQGSHTMKKLYHRPEFKNHKVHETLLI